MAVDVVMPQMGESIFEGTVTKWLKKPGDKVERDEPLFEISTDKVDAEIPAPASGTLKEIKVTEGQTVPIKTIVALIDSDGAAAPTGDGASAAAAPPPAAVAPPPPPPAPVAAAPPPPPRPAVPAPAAPVPVPAARPAEGERIRSSPLVRKMAREHGIDLARVAGTGAGGRISKRDMEAYLGSGGAAPSAPTPGAPVPAPAPAAAAAGTQAHVALEVAVPREKLYFGRYQVQPMSVMRQRIAEHMVISKRVSPHVYSMDEADLTKIVELRNKLKAPFEEQTGTKLTFMPFFVRAAVEALRAFPTVNASADGSNVVLHREINIGIAVALDWGLIVPVIKAADEKNFLGLQRAMNDLAERARTKRLKPEEVQEGTFSITNPGVFGGLMGLPVINQPNVAILGLGAIQKRPVVINDAIAIRSMVYITLSYDHRVVDGAVAHQFLQRIKQTLEDWTEPIL
ncbi:MAG TPA: 2-oxoglutarate dehydrogenase, E2 component, dihydrolipoamide succinyltransferase [Candidatus Acidoferrales bacterium]|nr:2-oxoglutarate dehydrogenase, E2 component, dihydrolipoamide succinyltransferase [Candidatus Acidoferrales bacterium]